MVSFGKSNLLGIALVLTLAACGDNRDSGDGTGSIIVLGGVWTITETGKTDDCGLGTPVDPPYAVVIRQTGSDVTLIDDEGEVFTGTISESSFSVTATFDDAGDTYVATFNATLTGDTMTGTISIAVTGPGVPGGNCNFNVTFNATKKTTLLNGGFESGDFTNWVTLDLSDPFSALTVNNSSALEGSFGVGTGFDGDGGPGNDKIFVAQDVDLNDLGSASVSFDWEIVSCDVNFGTLPRVFSLVIEPAGGGTALFSQTIFTCAAGTSSSNPPVDDQVIDISAAAGEPVRIKFQWLVPEDFTGPASARLDDVKLLP